MPGTEDLARFLSESDRRLLKALRPSPTRLLFRLGYPVDESIVRDGCRSLLIPKTAAVWNGYWRWDGTLYWFPP